MFIVGQKVFDINFHGEGEVISICYSDSHPIRVRFTNETMVYTEKGSSATGRPRVLYSYDYTPIESKPLNDPIRSKSINNRGNIAKDIFCIMLREAVNKGTTGLVTIEQANALEEGIIESSIQLADKFIKALNQKDHD